MTVTRVNVAVQDIDNETPVEEEDENAEGAASGAPAVNSVCNIPIP